MREALAEIEARIRSLTREERAELIRALVADLDGGADDDVENAWLSEADKRQREINEGTVRTIPAERVFENLRSRHRG